MDRDADVLGRERARRFVLAPMVIAFWQEHGGNVRPEVLRRVLLAPQPRAPQAYVALQRDALRGEVGGGRVDHISSIVA